VIEKTAADVLPQGEPSNFTSSLAIAETLYWNPKTE
jgi:hypothetical protein